MREFASAADLDILEDGSFRDRTRLVGAFQAIRAPLVDDRQEFGSLYICHGRGNNGEGFLYALLKESAMSLHNSSCCC